MRLKFRLFDSRPTSFRPERKADNTLLLFTLVLIICLSACLAKTPPPSPLHQALSDDKSYKIPSLLKKGVKVDAVNEFGDTPLFVAARKGDFLTVEMLVQKGADVNFQNRISGETPLICAAKSGSPQIVEFLLVKGSSINDRDRIGGSPLVWGCRKGHLKVVELLIKHGANPEATNGPKALIAASSFGHSETVRYLLKKASDINSSDEMGHTALIAAARFGHIETLSLLLRNGADIEAMDIEGSTPLIWATKVGNAEVIEWLLRKGAVIDATDGDGASALSHAARLKHANAVNILIKHGADVNIVAKKKKTPLFFSAFNEEIANVLYANGGNILSVEEDENNFHASALSYEWLAKFYEEKLKDDRIDASVLIENIIFCYEMSKKYFERTSKQCKHIAKEIHTQGTIRIATSLLLNVLSMAAAQYEANLNANQTAEISALKSPSGVGKGYGLATYTVYRSNTDDLESLEKRYRAKAQKFSRKALECEDRIVFYRTTHK